MKLKEIRKSKKITQTEIAKKLGITQQAYQQFEAGTNDTTVKNLIKICNILNVTPNEILDFTETK